MSSNQGHSTRILIIGKTGNGKSTVGNIILRQKMFAVGTGMACTTVSTATRSSARNGRIIEVTDTPDLSNQYHTVAEIQAEVKKWKGDPETTPDAVLLAVRCDVRYTAEEFAIYQQVKKIWGHDLCRRLVVAFTFGDRQDRDLGEELGTVCHELKSVLKDASDRYVLFRGPASSENEGAVELLLEKIDKLKRLLKDASGRYSMFPRPVGSQKEAGRKSLKTNDDSRQSTLSVICKGCRDVLLFIWYLILWMLQAVCECFRGLIGGWNRNPPYRPL
ncbi:GTPase IMAP family member 4-like [Pomacea canaliculata]|uniref:GTPase IMAP family member 4-like n=1 Tax=Pomacea canaliculata TaxID=400727 RepID=UPI000D738E40|nr:GTPase IMAP family member 4-like [Pomacea canaliculata]